MYGNVGKKTGKNDHKPSPSHQHFQKGGMFTSLPFPTLGPIQQAVRELLQ